MSMKLLGAKTLATQLLKITLPDTGKEAIGKEALAAAKIIQKNIQAEAPKGPTGNLKKGIVAKRFKSRAGFPEAAFVQATAPHSHLIEFGTADRVRRSGGGTGRVDPNPFFSRGILRSEAQVETILTGAVEKMINDLTK